MEDKMRRFKVAVVQAAPVAFDRERTLAKVHTLAADAARQGARLVVFPEAFVSAYPRGLDFGAVVGSRTDEGPRGLSPVLGEQRRDPRRGRGQPGAHRPGARHLPGGWRGRTRRRHAVLFGRLLCAGRRVSRQAPQDHADRVRTAGLGVRRWIDAAGLRHAARKDRRGDLLGELPAADARGDVRERDRALLRADGGSQGHVGGVDAAHRGRGAMLRARVQPVQSPPRFPRGLSFGVWRRSGDHRHARRQLHRRSVRQFPRRAELRRAKPFWWPRSIRRRSSGGSSIWMSSATTRGPISFNSTSTSGRSSRSPSTATRNSELRIRIWT